MLVRKKAMIAGYECGLECGLGIRVRNVVYKYGLQLRIRIGVRIAGYDCRFVLRAIFIGRFAG